MSNLFLKNQQFIIQNSVVDCGSYTRLLLKLRREERKEKKKKSKRVGDLVAIL